MLSYVFMIANSFEDHLVMAPGGNPGGGGGKGNGNGNGNGNGGGNPKGDLYGDQIVVLRDLDPLDDGGNGEPVLDDYNEDGQMIAVGYDPTGEYPTANADGLFPIYFEEVGDGDYEIPEALLPYVQEVELERANVARAPDRVMEKALDAAVEKLITADEIKVDAAGRLMYSTDGGDTFLTIDAPLENLAIYTALMTAGTSGAWPDVQADWGEIQVGDDVVDLSFLADADLGFDPSALMGAAWSKAGEITLDALLYENTTLDVNEVTQGTGAPSVDYFDFTDGTTETYDYVRSAEYEDTWLRWIEYDDVSGDPYFEYGTVYDAVFGGVEWEDTYLAVDTNGNDDPSDDVFYYADASDSGANDFAQAADDSRAVIEFMHSMIAVEVTEDMVPDDYFI